MSAKIHPTAIVEEGARLGADVQIGPYCIVGPEVTLEDGVRLESHVVVQGRTRLGAGVQAFPFAAIGTPPQDLKYAGEPSTLEVGAGTRIREHATLHPGTEGGGMVTRVGKNCLLMVGAHVAHDCILGDNVIMANNATLGGHVVVGDRVVLGGLSAVHQFVRIGQGAMIGGMSGVEHDIIPYGLVMGDRARLSGLNLVGMKRRGLAKDEMREVSSAVSKIFSGDDTFKDRVEAVAKAYAGRSAVEEVVSFIRAESSRPICQPKPGAKLGHAG